LLFASPRRLPISTNSPAPQVLHSIDQAREPAFAALPIDEAEDDRADAVDRDTPERARLGIDEDHEIVATPPANEPVQQGTTAIASCRRKTLGSSSTTSRHRHRDHCHAAEIKAC